jgi:hypothetical protein
LDTTGLTVRGSQEGPHRFYFRSWLAPPLNYRCNGPRDAAAVQSFFLLPDNCPNSAPNLYRYYWRGERMIRDTISGLAGIGALIAMYLLCWPQVRAQAAQFVGTRLAHFCRLALHLTAVILGGALILVAVSLTWKAVADTSDGLAGITILIGMYAIPVMGVLFWTKAFAQKSDETIYAERIYEAFAEQNLVNMPPEKLRLPKETHRRYREKALLYREAWSLCALNEMANDLQLRPVLRELEGVVEAKRARRGLRDLNREQVMYAAIDSVEDLFADPFKWAKRWLMEFRNDPDDNFMVVPFANEWQRHYLAVKAAIKQTRPNAVPPESDERVPGIKAWHEVLGVNPKANLTQIKAAYREKIALYHPDKVVGLGLELRQLAEVRAKEITAAYALACKLRQ